MKTLPIAELAAHIAHLPDARIRDAAIEHDVPLIALMRLVRMERQARESNGRGRGKK